MESMEKNIINWYTSMLVYVYYNLLFIKGLFLR